MLNTSVKKLILYIIGIILIFIICYWILPYSFPFVLAFLTAILLNPITNIVQKRFKNQKRKVSVIIVFLCFLTFIGIFTYFLSTKVVGEVIQFAEKTPIYINSVNNVIAKADIHLNKISKNLPSSFVSGASGQAEDFLNRIKDDLTSPQNIANFKSIFTNIPKLLLDFLVYIIALFLFLLELPIISDKVYSHFTEKTTAKVNFMTSRLSFVIFGYLKAQFLISIIVFLLSLIGLLYIFPDIALLMSFFIWVIDFIPIIGSIVILAPWALFYFLLGNVMFGVKLTILAAVLITTRRLLESKVMRGQIRLSPISTLISMYLGFKLFGIFGIAVGPFLVIAFNSAREAGIIKINLKL